MESIMLNFLDRISKKSSNIKLHKNPFIGSRAVPSGRTDMTKLTVAFLNFAHAHEQINGFGKYEMSYQTDYIFREICAA
jgi:hypothetical protein